MFKILKILVRLSITVPHPVSLNSLWCCPHEVINTAAKRSE